MYACSFKDAIGIIYFFIFLLNQHYLNCVQYDLETSQESVRYHKPPQVMLAYLKYQWSVGDDLKRKKEFVRLQVYITYLNIIFMHTKY